MELKDIASIAGKPGLFRIVKPTRTGVIVETLNKKKTKSVATASSRVSVLKEVSIYTNDKEESISLAKVFLIMKEKFAKKLPIESKSSDLELMEFLEEVLPQYDGERVYPSDVKKLISWYKILWEFAPDIFDNLEEKSEENKEEVAEESEKSEESKE